MRDYLSSKNRPQTSQSWPVLGPNSEVLLPVQDPEEKGSQPVLPQWAELLQLFQSAFKALHWVSTSKTFSLYSLCLILWLLRRFNAAALNSEQLPSTQWISGSSCLAVELGGRWGLAPQWSSLTERSFCVRVGAVESSVAHLTCGAPQGFILGLLLFSLYSLPLFPFIYFL